MKFHPKSVLALTILFFSLPCFSQNNDTLPKGAADSSNLPKRAMAYAADKFALYRPLNVEFIHASPYNFTATRGNTALPESRVTQFSQLKASANFNFIKKQNWMLGATLGYRNTNASTDMLIPGTANGVKAVDENFHYFFSTLNFTYFSTLFNKRVIYTSSLIVDGSDQYVERLKGVITGTMVLKANQRTKLLAGLLINIDPSAQTPIIPTISYEHKFNNGLITDIVFPRSLYLRKFVFQRSGRISLGTELDRTSFYLYNIDGTDQRYEYRHLDLNNGLVYEHAIGGIMLTAKTGMKFTTSGRLFRKEDSFNDAVYQTKPDPTFYISVGASFNPFTVFGKKKQ